MRHKPIAARPADAGRPARGARANRPPAPSQATPFAAGRGRRSRPVPRPPPRICRIPDFGAKRSGLPHPWGEVAERGGKFSDVGFDLQRCVAQRGVFLGRLCRHGHRQWDLYVYAWWCHRGPRACGQRSGQKKGFFSITNWSNLARINKPLYYNWRLSLAVHSTAAGSLSGAAIALIPDWFFESLTQACWTQQVRVQRYWPEELSGSAQVVSSRSGQCTIHERLKRNTWHRYLNHAGEGWDKSDSLRDHEERKSCCRCRAADKPGQGLVCLHVTLRHLTTCIIKAFLLAKGCRGCCPHFKLSVCSGHQASKQYLWDEPYNYSHCLSSLPLNLLKGCICNTLLKTAFAKYTRRQPRACVTALSAIPSNAGRPHCPRNSY